MPAGCACSRLPNGLSLDQTTRNGLKGAAEEDRKKSHPKLPSPFSLLCNLLMIRFEGEPAERGRDFPLGPHAGRCHPSPFYCPVAGPKSSFSVRLEGRGDSLLQASPPPPDPVPLSPAPLRLVASPRVICKRGFLTLLPVSCFPGPPRPRAMAVSVPKGQGRNTGFPFPLWLRGLHGKIPLSTMPLAIRLGRGRTMGSPHPDSASWLQALLSDHG